MLQASDITNNFCWDVQLLLTSQNDSAIVGFSIFIWGVLFIFFSPHSFFILVYCHNVSVWPFITWRTSTPEVCLNPVRFLQCYYKIFAASHFSLEGPLRLQLCTVSSMPSLIVCLIVAIVAPWEFGFNLVIEFSLEQWKISSVSTCWSLWLYLNFTVFAIEMRVVFYLACSSQLFIFQKRNSCGCRAKCVMRLELKMRKNRFLSL